MRKLPLRFALLTVAMCGSLVGCSLSGTIAGSGEAAARAPLAARVLDVESASLRDTFVSSPKDTDKFWQERDLSEAAGVGGSENDDFSNAPNDEATGAYVNPTDGGVISQEVGVGLPPSEDGGEFAPEGLAAKTNGRLYFEIGGSLYVCSATVVNAESRDVLVTAAHCVWDTEGEGVLADKMLFIPADKNNGEESPYGRWFGVDAVIPEQFKAGAKSADGKLTGEGWSYDYAYIKVAPNEEGQLIQDVTGGQGIAFGIPVETIVQVGYPSAPPFDGRSQRYCSASEWNRYTAGGYSIKCLMTPGSSGGAWLTRYDPVRGAGYVVGVTSTGNSMSANSNALGKHAYELFAVAGGIDNAE